MTAGFDWDEAYRSGFVPWEIGEVSPHLAAAFATWDPAPTAALELGCGSGHDAAWLSGQGVRVTAVDASAEALARARAGLGEADVRLVHADLRHELPLPDGSVQLVYDRGLLHHLAPPERLAVAQRAHAALEPGGRWLCLAGSADDVRDIPGPPGLSARELLDAVEPWFALIELRADRFVEHGGPGYPAWVCVLRSRTG